MLNSEKYFILPILCLYWLNNIAVATHISKNELKDIASNMGDNDSLNAVADSLNTPLKFVTYSAIGYGFTVGSGELER
jgi:hypothetical protein